MNDVDYNKYYALFDYSNPIKAQKQAEKWLGKNVKLYPSSKKEKKYMVQNPDGKWIHFGQFGMEDFLHHKSKDRQRLYRLRAENIKGNWKKNKYSPNNLSIHILW
jgi:2-phospho-L-lactate transferase/gluconeogenesis factor (CofD/UPF0052 family)